MLCLHAIFLGVKDIKPCAIVSIFNSCPARLHPPNLVFIRVFIEASIKVIPPLEQHRVTDQLEPRSEPEAVVLEHGLEAVLRHILRILNLIRIGFVVDIRFDDEYIVDCGPVQQLDEIRFRRAIDLLSCSPHFPSLGAL